jgi:hypothetical protein
VTKIIIEAVKPAQMRLEAYREEGCGDWAWDAEGNLHIQIASVTDVWDDEAVFLVALHELIEARLCFKSGITQGEVDAFDATFKGDGERATPKIRPIASNIVPPV